MNLTSNLASLTVFLVSGLVRMDVAVCMIAGQLIGARSGSRLVIRDGTAIVRPVMLITVILLAAKLIWDQY